jgi:hypothetical protein
MTSTIQPSALTPHSTRNLVINGDFKIWQRGLTYTTNSPIIDYVAPDRWVFHVNGTGSSAKISRVEFNFAGHGEIPDGPRQFARLETLNSSNNYIGIFQYIENGWTSLSNQVITLSFWVRYGSSSSATINAYLHVDNDTTTVPISTSQQPAVQPNIWTKVVMTGTVPTRTGTFGIRDNLKVILRATGLLNGEFVDFANIQLEYGYTSTPHQLRRYGEELELCQRYYTKSYELETTPSTITDQGAVAHEEPAIDSIASFGFVEFPVQMRVTPSVSTFSNITGTAGKVRDVIQNADRSLYSINGLSDRGFHGITTTTNFTNGGGQENAIKFQWTADAEIR